MLNLNVTSATRPDSVRLEHLPEGMARALLAQNIRKVTTEYEEGETEIAYVYDEAIFFVPDGQAATKTAIEANFESWWTYASQPEEEAPTIEDRVSANEEAIAAIMEMMIGGDE